MILSTPAMRRADPAATITAPQDWQGITRRARWGPLSHMHHRLLTSSLKCWPRTMKFRNRSKAALAGDRITTSPGSAPGPLPGPPDQTP